MELEITRTWAPDRTATARRNSVTPDWILTRFLAARKVTNDCKANRNTAARLLSQLMRTDFS